MKKRKEKLKEIKANTVKINWLNPVQGYKKESSTFQVSSLPKDEPCIVYEIDADGVTTEEQAYRLAKLLLSKGINIAVPESSLNKAIEAKK